MLVASGHLAGLGAILVAISAGYYLINAVFAGVALCAERRPGGRPLALLTLLVAIAELASCAAQRNDWNGADNRVDAIWYQWTAAPAVLLLIAVWSQIRPSTAAPGPNRARLPPESRN